MNSNLHIPRLRTVRKNPQWLIHPARWIAAQRKRLHNFTNRIKHYRDYRQLGQGIAESWDKAGRTI